MSEYKAVFDKEALERLDVIMEKRLKNRQEPARGQEGEYDFATKALEHSRKRMGLYKVGESK